MQRFEIWYIARKKDTHDTWGYIHDTVEAKDAERAREAFIAVHSKEYELDYCSSQIPLSEGNVGRPFFANC